MLIARSRDGAVVRALASHQYGPGSIPGPAVICGLSLLLVLFLAPRGFFFSGTLTGFPLFSKINISKFCFDLDCQHFCHKPLAREIAQALPVFDIKFKFTFTTIINGKIKKKKHIWSDIFSLDICSRQDVYFSASSVDAISAQECINIKAEKNLCKFALYMCSDKKE